MVKKAESKRFLTIRETAELMGLSPRTIWNRTGPRAKIKFPVRARRFGRAVRFALQDVLDYMESC